MRFSLQREVFLKPLAHVVNVVERRQTLPVLANLLVQVKGGQLSLTGTDLEVEMVARQAVDDAQDGETTIPARKLFEIVRALPDGSKVTVTQSGDKVTVQAGRSRFTLASLPANDFPSVDEVEATERVRVSEAGLKELTEHSLPEIGDAFAGRDHTTVLHACRQVKHLQETDGKLREDWDKLIRKLSE